MFVLVLVCDVLCKLHMIVFVGLVSVCCFARWCLRFGFALPGTLLFVLDLLVWWTCVVGGLRVGRFVFNLVV